MSADLAILLAFALMMGFHEMRAIGRDRIRKADQAAAMAELRDNRRLMLGAIDQRHGTEARVIKVERKVEEIDGRVLALESRSPR